MSNLPDIRQLIVNYLTDQKLMQLATVNEAGPWICSVWQAFDDELNIYFFSAVTRQHSLEIEKNGHVAGALAKPQLVDDAPRGLQFSGLAQKLTNADDITKARAVYQDRIFDAQKIDMLMAHPERPHAFYKVTPNRFMLFDALNFPDNPKQELLVNQAQGV